MTLKELLVGFGTQVRSIWMIGLHAFAKRETRMYPEEPVYLPPRYHGLIAPYCACQRMTAAVTSKLIR
ncbi:hypothetical protein ACUOCP_39035, partial [Escherichia sp. R-CC3]